jgi:hypothetical protein
MPTKYINFYVLSSKGGIPMVKRSKGIKRITLIISVLSAVGWISYVGVVSEGFSQVKPIGWLIFAGVLFIACFIPQMICKVIYWVIDGFKEDKNT